MATYHFTAKAGTKGNGASATIHAEYILRQGKYANRQDLENTGQGNMPDWGHDNPIEFWRAADLYERQNGVVYREHQLALPIEASPKERKAIIDQWCNQHYKQHAYLYAVHNKEGNPHCHIMICDRQQDGIERAPDLYFKRQASTYRDRKSKELVKPDPVRGGCPKSQKWNGKDRNKHLERLRMAWADIQNNFYNSRQLYGLRVDHRSLKDQEAEMLSDAQEFEAEGLTGDAAVFRRIAAKLDREPDHRINHRDYRIMQRTGQIKDLKTYRQANREAAAAKAELLAARENRNKLYKQQQAIYAARAIAWETENLRRDKIRSKRSLTKSVGRLAVNILPPPLGEAIQITTELLIMIAKIDDWRQAQAYKRHVDQLTTRLHQLKATRLAAEKAKEEKVKHFVPVSTAPITALIQYKPTLQQPALPVYGPEVTAAALIAQANKETGRQRALYLKIADRVEQLPPHTIIYQMETELPPKQLLETAAAAVKRWQDANPEKTTAHAEEWNLKHPDLAELLSVATDVSRRESVKVTEVPITAIPSQIAQQYRDYARQIYNSDPAKARTLTAISNDELDKTPNAKEITLPVPSAELGEIRAALKRQGIKGGRKR